MSPSDLFCSSCGARNDTESAFCRSCGAGLATPAPPPPAEIVPPPPPRPWAAIPPTPTGPSASARSNPLPLLLAVGAIVVLLLVVLVEAVLIVLPQGAVSDAGRATLSLLQGQVQLQKRGQGDWMEVAQDVAVEAGDHIRTGESSYAVLSFLEGTTTQLSALTELTIRELQVAPGQEVVIRLDLDLGEIWNRIAQLPADSVHEVSTLAATVTCHGSEYGVVVNDMGTTWIRGQQGRVEVTGGGSTVPVAPGDTLMVELGSAPVSYGQVAMVPTAPAAEETPETGTASVEGADMPTFLNQPLPTGTPTNTPPPTSTPRPVPPSPTPTATTRPQPTATPRHVDCPTITIREPSRAPARGPFGIEFDRTGEPGGFAWVVEFRQPNGPWNRAEPVPANVSKRGQYWMADLRAPGEGEYGWRICLVKANDLRGEVVCCSAEHMITHATDEPCGT